MKPNPELPLVPEEPDVPLVPVLPVIVTVILPPPLSVTEAPLNVIPVTPLYEFVPSPTVIVPPPAVNPVISTLPPSALSSVNV